MRFAGAVGVIGVFAWLAGSSATALTITYDLDVEFSNGTPPEGATPWTTITLDDSVGPDVVRVTIANVNLTDNEAVTEFSLNFDPTLDPTQLTMTVVNAAAVGGAGNVGFSTGVDAFQADGDGKFDILFDLPPPPGSFASRFSAGETLVFDINCLNASATCLSGITAASFDFTSATGGGQGTFHAAAHVQGIGPEDADSGWIGDAPEAGTMGLLALGMAGILPLARRAARTSRSPHA
jgi:hypothetical protein